MKASKFIALPLAYAICLVLLANEAQAKDATEQVQEQVQNVADWSKDQVQAYLDKYQIAYDKNDESLVETVQRYRDQAMANANYFITDKRNTIESLIDGIKIKLEKQYKMTAENIAAFTNDIQHELKQLELSGSLTQDKVKQSLDNLQHKAVKQKYVSEAQYKEIANDLASSFTSPTWFQKIFGGVTHSGHFNDDSFNTWLSSSVTQRLQENKQLTKEEIQGVVDTLKTAIASTSAKVQDLNKLATKDWWAQLSRDLEKNAKLKKDQVQGVVDSLKDEVNAYKIFAIDYAGEAADHSQHVFAAAGQYIKDKGNYIYEAVVQSIKPSQNKAESIVSAASSATDAAASSASSYAASATDAAAASVSVLRAQASQSVYDAKDSFGHFWRQKERETYKKIGYTEAHIDWMENYLSKTFNDKKNLAKETIHQAVRTIRQYLVQAKVQTTAHIDAQLKSLEGLVESWRRTAVRDEL